MKTTLTALFEHNLWANNLTLDVCSGLTDGQLNATMPGIYGSIRAMLVHIFGAEERYVCTLTNATSLPPMRESEPFPGIDELRAWCEQSGRKLIEIAEDAQPDTILRGTRRNGQQYEVLNTVILTQAINHATEHRCQINTMLTQLGLEPVDHDAWAYAGAHHQIKML